MDGEADFMENLSEVMKDPSRALCDDSKKTLFSVKKMTARYLELFGKV